MNYYDRFSWQDDRADAIVTCFGSNVDDLTILSQADEQARRAWRRGKGRSRASARRRARRTAWSERFVVLA